MDIPYITSKLLVIGGPWNNHSIDEIPLSQLIAMQSAPHDELTQQRATAERTERNAYRAKMIAMIDAETDAEEY